MSPPAFLMTQIRVETASRHTGRNDKATKETPKWIECRCLTGNSGSES